MIPAALGHHRFFLNFTALVSFELVEIQTLLNSSELSVISDGLCWQFVFPLPNFVRLVAPEQDFAEHTETSSADFMCPEVH